MGIRPLSWAKGRSQAGILYKRMVLWLDLIIRGFTVQLSYPNFPLVYPNWGTVTVLLCLYAYIVYVYDISRVAIGVWFGFVSYRSALILAVVSCIVLSFEAMPGLRCSLDGDLCFLDGDLRARVPPGVPGWNEVLRFYGYP